MCGSPPRVWGQRLANNKLQRIGRFTPTRVGTTSPVDPCVRRGPVHPHACGDNDPARIARAILVGSPPRVWGQQLWWSHGLRALRFTPTRVGTTTVLLSTNLVRYGSPPRVWGQRKKDQGAHYPGRFTPTRVGTTFLVLRMTAQTAVHPHACGDNNLPPLSRSSITGSPPRVWGQHWAIPHYNADLVSKIRWKYRARVFCFAPGLSHRAKQVKWACCAMFTIVRLPFFGGNSGEGRVNLCNMSF